MLGLGESVYARNSAVSRLDGSEAFGPDSHPYNLPVALALSNTGS